MAPSTHFGRALRDRRRDETGRRWLYVPYDQLSDRIGPLSREDPEELGIVLVECPGKAARRPYHRQKLAYVLANQRQFALEQAERGVAVRYEVTEHSYREALEGVVAELGPVRLMEPAERELRTELRPLVEEGGLQLDEHEGWLTNREQFLEHAGAEPPWRMDVFYRGVRRDSGLLMEEGSPEGGRFSHDGDNRRRWSGEPPAPQPPTFEPDEVTREVGELIEERFSRHPGALDLEHLPATREDAERLWAWALDECMESFGPYEDAMSVESSGLFHTRISPLLNLHRLLPRQVVEEVAALDVPINSREGFVRQVLGWREFMRHVHRETDGFRSSWPAARRPGDGGWSKWSGEPWTGEPGTGATTGIDGGAEARYLGVDSDLPPAFWGQTSGLKCLDRVVADVWREGWSHHITRLMVLGNLATLLDVSPRQLTDWFWAAYVDAYDWVVEPNVLGMGSYGLGDLFVTKPYVSGSNYIDKMSDYCSRCRFDPKRDCPIAHLYWQFLERHRDRLEGNQRLAMPLRSLARRSPEKKERDRYVYRVTASLLGRGKPVRPESFEGEG